MMRALLALLLSSALANAAYVAINVTFTNAPVTGNTFTRNGSTATWTNAPINTASWITTNGVTGSATNLMLWLTANYPSLNTRMTTASNIYVAGTDLALSLTGAYATLTTNSQPTTNWHSLLIPWDTQPYSTNRTNDANELIYGLNKYATTNAFSEGAAALANHVSLVATQIVKNKILTNSTVQGGSASNVTLVNIATASGTIGSLTNGILQSTKLTNASGTLNGIEVSNAIVQSLVVTNPTAYGSVSVNESTGNLGYASLGALVWYWVADTNGAFWLENTDNGDVPFRLSASSGGGTTFTLPLAVSNSASITLGLTASNVVAQTALVATNVSIGAGTNYWRGDISVSPRLYTSLVNGDNTDLDYGTNAAIYASGGTTTVNLHSFVEGRTYQRFRMRMSGATNHIIFNESGTEGTAGRRITTGTGGNLTLTNQPTWAEFEYTGSRWEVVSHGR
jgi:hypothetical protein